MDTISPYTERLFAYLQNTARNISTTRPEDLILPGDYFIQYLLFLGCWILLYTVVHNLPIMNETKKKTLDSKNRVVSIIHATVMLFLCIYDYLYLQEEKCGNTNSSFQNNVLIFSCSYFTYDMLACWYFGISDAPMFVHHFMVIIAEYSGILYSSSASEMIRAMISAEVSNPVMHLRSIAGNYGLKHSKIYLAFEAYYFFSYSFARLIFGFQVSLFTVFCPDNLTLVKISGAVVWLQSLKYAYNMIGITMKRMKESAERKAKGVSLFWFEYNPQLTTLNYVKADKSEKYVP